MIKRYQLAKFSALAQYTTYTQFVCCGLDIFCEKMGQPQAKDHRILRLWSKVRQKQKMGIIEVIQQLPA